jgi:hypothetical protein
MEMQNFFLCPSKMRGATALAGAWCMVGGVANRGGEIGRAGGW